MVSRDSVKGTSNSDALSMGTRPTRRSTKSQDRPLEGDVDSDG